MSLSQTTKIEEGTDACTVYSKEELHLTGDGKFGSLHTCNTTIKLFLLTRLLWWCVSPLSPSQMCLHLKTWKAARRQQKERQWVRESNIQLVRQLQARKVLAGSLISLALALCMLLNRWPLKVNTDALCHKNKTDLSPNMKPSVNRL